MKIEDFISAEWVDPISLSRKYMAATPFEHIKLSNFIRSDVLESVAKEFPDLAKVGGDAIQHSNGREVKYASKGMSPLSPSALKLVSFLNSDVFLEYLQKLTGINETLISDPYLAGGGYHEIKPGGFLKIHADFNKHPIIDLDRRLNLILYLNKNWDPRWGGGLELYDQDMSEPKVTVVPDFNTAILFSTRSDTFHGHPDALACPEERSRRSLALYYFSAGRPEDEINETHSTVFKERAEDNFAKSLMLRNFIREITPPILLKAIKKWKK